MDIAITMPKDLWLKIVSGDKSVEMRKWGLPKHFNLTLDRIYVVLKGTQKIVGNFQVVYVESRIRKNSSWSDFGKYLGVPYDWFSKYWGNSCVMYFFVIGDCTILDRHVNMGVSHAPQKYINIITNLKS